MKIKKYFIRKLGLKGSWAWAKRQMIKGEVVRGKHWTGTLKLKIDSPDNQLLKACFWGNANNEIPPDELWENAIHHLRYENFTDYEIVNHKNK